MGASDLKPIRIGALGAARITPMAVIEPARDNPDVTVAAIASRDLERARKFAARHGVPKVHASYEDLLADQSVLRQLEEFLGLRLDRTVLGKKVGGTGKERISKMEQAMCLLVASSTLAHYGYGT